ncbi:MAG: methyltransferase domain-containing protein [Verrucomicrobiota bacterium]
MNRIVQAELLDELPPDDPGAIQSRRDLRRLNAWMGNARTIAKNLRHAFPGGTPGRVVELGGGDGEFLLQVARQNRPRNSSPRVNALLVDQQNLLRPETQTRFQASGWNTRAIQTDVFQFLQNGAESADAFIANLFLHHFSDVQLRTLFQLASRHTQVFIAVEPRRSPLALRFSRWVGAIGCNSVTRHDAVVSVEAGFAGRELSALWPDSQNWDLTERHAGFFSHFFVARRKT